MLSRFYFLTSFSLCVRWADRSKDSLAAAAIALGLHSCSQNSRERPLSASAIDPQLVKAAAAAEDDECKAVRGDRSRTCVWYKGGPDLRCHAPPRPTWSYGPSCAGWNGLELSHVCPCYWHAQEVLRVGARLRQLETYGVAESGQPWMRRRRKVSLFLFTR